LVFSVPFRFDTSIVELVLVSILLCLVLIVKEGYHPLRFWNSNDWIELQYIRNVRGHDSD
jgi:hypothetical protein